MQGFSIFFAGPQRALHFLNKSLNLAIGGRVVWCTPDVSDSICSGELFKCLWCQLWSIIRYQLFRQSIPSKEWPENVYNFLGGRCWHYHYFRPLRTGIYYNKNVFPGGAGSKFLLVRWPKIYVMWRHAKSLWWVILWAWLACKVFRIITRLTLYLWASPAVSAYPNYIFNSMSTSNRQHFWQSIGPAAAGPA